MTETPTNIHKLVPIDNEKTLKFHQITLHRYHFSGHTLAADIAQEEMRYAYALSLLVCPP